MVLSIAIGAAFISAGVYGARWAHLGIVARVVVGVLMLASGAVLSYPIIFGGTHPLEHPVVLGFAAGLVGLGINQTAAPLRVAMGKAP